MRPHHHKPTVCFLFGVINPLIYFGNVDMNCIVSPLYMLYIVLKAGGQTMRPSAVADFLSFCANNKCFLEERGKKLNC